jgi:hypothetical protein
MPAARCGYSPWLKSNALIFLKAEMPFCTGVAGNFFVAVDGRSIRVYMLRKTKVEEDLTKLFDLHFQQHLISNERFKFVAHHTFAHTRRSTGKNEVADVEGKETRHMFDDFVETEMHL